MTVFRLVPQDFQMVSGNDKTLNFTVLDENDLVVDLTGATIVWALADSEKSKSRIITYTSPVNVTITTPLEGKFSVSIQSADTEPLKPKDYYHEARVTSSGGDVTTVAIGTVEVLRNVIDI